MLFPSAEIVSSVESELLESERGKVVPKEWRALFRRENKRVAFIRLLVFVVLFLATVVVSVGAYTYAKLDEKHEFEDDFLDISVLLVTTFQESFDIKLGLVNHVATSMTSYAIQNNLTFPFVTIPHFALMGSGLRVAAETFILHWLPLVTDDNRDEWERYALQNRFQMNKSYDLGMEMNAKQDAEYGLPSDEEGGNDSEDDNIRNLQEDPNMLNDGSGFHLRIWANGGIGPEPNGTGPFVPIWQSSPVNARRQFMINFNFDRGNAFRGLSPLVLKNKKAVISMIDIPGNLGKGNVRDNLLLSQYRYVAEVSGAEPLTFLAYPVFDTFGDDRNVVGILATNVLWNIAFANILPASTVGIVCVLENSYNQTFAYRIDGPNVTFLGEGDPHDRTYDNLEVVGDMSSYLESRSGPQNRAYTTVPLDMENGRYVLRIYPSKDFQDRYSTKKPISYMIVIDSVFLVTFFAFVAFSSFAERRQKIVLERAVQSGTIVSSLFPKHVQDRLYKPIASSIREIERVKNDATNVSSEQLSHGPICDLYPEVTIMFSDLPGFAVWSAKRQPNQVFSFLEKLYHLFDDIAEKRNVFKVETIGDCYVCVTGLPEPQTHHAVIITKFANKCMKNMQSWIEDDDDGEHISCNLQMRVGLHSGSVMGGVLRGQKSRFQLFGDTMNTASRMQTTGTAGKIHISKTTADALIQSGREHWITPRQDKVFAKGKGDLETYWVIATGHRSCVWREG